ncbi:hypothetical protein JXA85_04860 [Candidatus Woesearchaeota archaeon]|nr:hypothetical protein [Candidatus Woesearchaeota archaeon]
MILAVIDHWVKNKGHFHGTIEPNLHIGLSNNVYDKSMVASEIEKILVGGGFVWSTLHLTERKELDIAVKRALDLSAAVSANYSATQKPLLLVGERIDESKMRVRRIYEILSSDYTPNAALRSFSYSLKKYDEC